MPQTQRIRSKLLPTEFNASCFGVCNTMSLAGLHTAGRQGPRDSTLRYGDVAQLFFWSNISCVWFSPSLKEVPA